MKINTALHRIKHYARYVIYAKNIHSIHSPFLFQFVKECFDKKKHFHVFNTLANTRKKLLNNTCLIDYHNVGHESYTLNKKATIKDITKIVTSPQKYSELYFRITNFLNAKTVLELGTSLGLNTLYLAYATSGKVITIEGQKDLCAFANTLFKEHHLHNIKLVHAPFDTILPEIAKKNIFDIVFIDGNHTYEATIHYYSIVKPKMSPTSVIILDDIYWNEQMTKAWKEIKQDESIKITLDLYRCGMVIFTPNILYSQHFILRY